MELLEKSVNTAIISNVQKLNGNINREEKCNLFFKKSQHRMFIDENAMSTKQ